MSACSFSLGCRYVGESPPKHLDLGCHPGSHFSFLYHLLPHGADNLVNWRVCKNWIPRILTRILTTFKELITCLALNKSQQAMKSEKLSGTGFRRQARCTGTFIEEVPWVISPPPILSQQVFPFVQSKQANSAGKACNPRLVLDHSRNHIILWTPAELHYTRLGLTYTTLMGGWQVIPILQTGKQAQGCSTGSPVF